MMNFFLLNEAIMVTNNDFIEGMKLLVSIDRRQNTQYLKHESIWNLSQISWLYGNYTQSNQVIINYIHHLSSCTEYIGNKNKFDSVFPNECNGFLGIDFTNTHIPTQLQIIDESTHQAFEQLCFSNRPYNTVKEFWDTKETIFTHLVFCERVLEQIDHLSVNDNRFKQIIEKLTILNQFTGQWQNGNFNFKNLPLENSPDTPSRIKDTLTQRTFDCPNIGKKVFSYHIKWYVGGEPFRLYYYPSNTDYKVYVGYIGNKSDIGF